MPFENDAGERTSRRSLLKTVGGGALVTLGLGAGNAAAADTTSDDCWYEYKCLELICPEESSDGGSTEEKRQCCEDPETGEVTCDDWEYSGCCSFSG